MAPINLALSAFKRSGFPEAATVNCLVERSPTIPNAPESLIARPGLEDFQTVGTAPIRGLFQKRGLFDDAAMIVADTGVYTLSSSGTVTTLTGVAVAGDDLVDWDAGLDADGNSIARIANGSALYKVTGGTVTQEIFPTAGGAGASSVAFISGYWVAVEAGTDALYYQIPASSTWSAIQFASAEYQADRLVAVRQRGDQFVLLGEATTEVWYATGNASSPLEPYGGLKFDYGCRSRASAVNCQGALLWVDHNCSVRMFDGGEPAIISDNGLAEQIRNVAASDLRASFFIKDQHPCYVLTLGASATWTYDLAMKRWTRATSDGLNYWRAHLFRNLGDANDTVLAADALSNQVWRLAPDRRTDGSDTFTVEFSAFLPADEAPVPIANIELHCEVGGAPLSGQGSDPLIGMQVSYDGGKTFGTIRYRSLGATGKYRTRVRWNALGTASNPQGAVFRFYVSDPVVRRVSQVLANVP